MAAEAQQKRDTRKDLEEIYAPLGTDQLEKDRDYLIGAIRREEENGLSPWKHYKSALEVIEEELEARKIGRA